MRHKVDSLKELYWLLGQLEKPIALFDFLSGEMGYEALCAQAICGRFYDDVGGKCPVYALTWAGCSLWYENVSDHQIELADIELSMRGNQSHRGEPRWAWLVVKDHREQVGKVGGYAELIGPCYWAGGNVEDDRLAGFVPARYLMRKEGLMTDRVGIITSTANRLERTGHVFQPPEERIVKEPYIALFDRNETGRADWRNTQQWHIDWFMELAERYNFKPVIFSGLHPRKYPENVRQFMPIGRDIDLLCNVVRHAHLFMAPPCGAAEVACILGCDFVALGELGVGQEGLERMLTARGFEFFGMLGARNSDHVALAIRGYLEKCLAS